MSKRSELAFNFKAIENGWKELELDGLELDNGLELDGLE